MRLFRCCLVLTVTLWASASWAQLTPGAGPGMGQQPPQKTESKEGPAEAAPEQRDDDVPELPPLPPWPGQGTKKLQLFQLAGYFRFRVDMLHNLNLGMMDQGGLKAPFYTPISEHDSSAAKCSDRRGDPTPGGGDRDLDDDDCPGNTLAGANMRLRLEPTINIGEQVRVHTQLDVFDNLSLGSTPDRRSFSAESSTVPLDAFTASQAPPVAGQNSPRAAIMVKRAWGEVETPFGLMRFGRTPLHWGVGLLANDGGCWDCNYGDNADRFAFQTNLAGYTLGMSYDFAASGPTSLSVLPVSTYGGQAIDLEQLDDVIQLSWIAGQIDDEAVIQDKVDRGQLVLNYGLYLVWRQQDFDYAKTMSAAGGSAPGPDFGSSTSGWASAFMERHYWSIMPDLWFKLLWKKLYVELEGVLIAGQMENGAYDYESQAHYDILQFAWVARSSYRMLKDSLRVGLEVGMASGDQAEPNNADINRLRWHPLGLNNPDDQDSVIDRDGKLREFRFNPDYHVDLILFRELLGTVANAVYFKPWIQYLIVDSFGARLDAIYSLAYEPIAFPGNSTNLGLEFDLDIFYQNIEEKFFAGLQYGVLIPFGALDRPAEIYGSANAADAEVAHTLQFRVLVQF